MDFHKEFKPAPPGAIGPRINLASKILRCGFNKAANEEGLFSGQPEIILLLRHFEGLTVSQVARALNITAATASVSIKRMEKSGFIEKRPDETDARITRLYLTERGKIAPENIKEKMEAQELKITAGLSNDEVNTLSELLDRVINNIKGIEREDEQC